MTEKEAIESGILENKIVKLKPIPKGGKMIKDPKHFGYFMFDGAFKNYVLPRSTKSGSYPNIFKNGELEFFNDILQTDLSFSKRKENFWDTYSVRVVKDEKLMKKGLDFDLSDPYQNLDYRILKHLKITAPSYDERENNPKYIWYMAEENEELLYEAKETEKIEEIWTFFGTLKNSKKKMIDLLSVYYAEKSKSNEVDTNATIEFFISEIRKLIKNDPNFVLQCKNDDSYIVKAFIIDGVRCGAINKTGRNKYNIIGDTSNYDYIGLTKRIVDLKKNSDDDYIRIKEQITKYNKDNKSK